MTPLYFYKVSFLLIVIVITILDFAKSDTQMIKILPTTNGSLLTPKPRISNIPSSFAKNYWVPGTFFNSANFQGLISPQCTNLNPSVKKSLKPKVEGGCVLLFKDKDCKGTYTVVVTDEGNKTEMEVRMVKSMKPCPDDVDASWRETGVTKQQDQKKGDGDLED